MQVPRPSAADQPLTSVALCLDELLQADQSQRGALLRGLCATHPEFAGELERRYQALDRIGMLGDDAAATEPAEIDGFTLLGRLGEGGMGVVHLAHQQGLERKVAVKVLRPELAWLGSQRQRFLREGRVVARLEHPAIVPVLHVGEYGGGPYLVMAYVAGRSLAAVLAELHGRPPEGLDGRALVAALAAGPEGVDEVAVAASIRGLSARWSRVIANLLLPIADALGFAHEHGIVHRDVKPSNILLARDGRPMLCDFGLAALADREDSITRSGCLLGSVPYMSPEQVEGQPVDARSDVFSFGSVLYEALTLRRAFGSASTSHTMHEIAREEPRALASGAVPIDADLRAILARCHEKRPARRYRDGAELAADLRAFVEHRPVAARRLDPLHRVARYARREPMRFSLLLTTGTLALLLACLGGYLWAQRGTYEAGHATLRADLLEQHLGRGYLAMWRDDHTAAAAAFRSGLDVDHTCDEARTGLAMLAEAEAVPTTEHADTLAARFSAAVRLIFAGPFGDRSGARRASELLHDAVVRAPKARLLYHGMLAKAAAFAGDEATARRTAEALLQLWPDSAEAAHWAGHALIEFAPEAAVHAYERALQASPAAGHTWAGLGAARLLLGQTTMAIEALATAVRHDPADAMTWIDLGIAQQRAGCFDDAERSLRHAAGLPGAPSGACFNLGVLLAAKGDATGAADAFAAAVAANPTHAEAWYNLGALRTESGALDEGRAALRRVVSLRPQWTDAWRQLARNHALGGDAAGAAEAYRTVVELAPEDAQGKQYLESLRNHLEQHGGK